jgi:colanic acid biosynthesis glycosyl transferase WcaI
MSSLTIVSQWYPPEQSPFGKMMQELARNLAARGWDVTVITGFPNHPGGVLHPGYRRRWLSETTVDGVHLCRVWLALSPRRTRIGRLATFLSFTAVASWRIIRRRRPDVIFAVLQPLSMGLVLPIVARMKRAKLVFNLQDLHPEAQIRAGLISNRVVVRLLKAVEQYAYSSCAAMTAICDRFRRHAILKGATADRVFVVSNWIDTDRVRPLAEMGIALRREIGIADHELVILLAGTLGYASGADVVVEAAHRLRDQPNLRFLIVGEGPLLASLKDRAGTLALTNVLFLPFQDEARLPAIQSSADVALVTLSAQFAEVSVPSKLLAYFAAGSAVIAAVPEGSEIADIVRRAAAGVVVPAGDASALAAAVRSLAANIAGRAEFGRSARKYVVENLSLTMSIDRYEEIFRALCST